MQNNFFYFIYKIVHTIVFIKYLSKMYLVHFPQRVFCKSLKNLQLNGGAADIYIKYALCSAALLAIKSPSNFPTHFSINVATICTTVNTITTTASSIKHSTPGIIFIIWPYIHRKLRYILYMYISIIYTLYIYDGECTYKTWLMKSVFHKGLLLPCCGGAAHVNAV